MYRIFWSMISVVVIGIMTGCGAEAPRVASSDHRKPVERKATWMEEDSNDEPVEPDVMDDEPKITKKPVPRVKTKSRRPEPDADSLEDKSIPASELKKLDFDQITSRLGTPDDIYRSTKKSNVGLAVWKTGDNEYTVVSFVETIDGSMKTIVLAVLDKRPKSIVENMRRNFDKGLK